MNYPHNPVYDKWKSIVERWQGSGLSQPKFCELNQVSYSKFKYFRNRLRDIDYATNVVAVVPNAKSLQPSKFEPVQVSIPSGVQAKKAKSPALAVPIKVLLPNGVSVEVSEAVSALQLKNLVGVLLSC